MLHVTRCLTTGVELLHLHENRTHLTQSIFLKKHNKASLHINVG